MFFLLGVFGFQSGQLGPLGLDETIVVDDPAEGGCRENHEDGDKDEEKPGNPELSDPVRVIRDEEHTDLFERQLFPSVD